MNKTDNRKNLLVLASTYPRWRNDHEPGFVHELSKRLTSTFNVIVVCPHAEHSKTYENIDDVNIYRYRYAPARLESLVNDGGIIANIKNSPWKFLLLPCFFIAQLIFVKRLLKTHNIDVIHAHWLIPQGLTLALLSLVMKVPHFVTTSHGADLFALKGNFFNKIKLFVSKKSTLLTVVSEVMKSSLIKLGVAENKIAILPMGVNMNNFSPNIKIERSKKEILFVGRLVEKKGLLNLITVLPNIIEKHPDIQLTIVGFGPEKMSLQYLVNELQLNDKVEFIGAVTQKKLAIYYQKAAVFVAPFIEAKSGDQEGLGLVLVEAIACGCPVVVSNIPACKDVIDNMKGIYVFDSVNNERLSHKLNEALSAEPLTIQAQQNNRIKLKQNFCWSQVAKKYSNQLQEITKKEPL